jgi:hypothetical protein
MQVPLILQGESAALARSSVAFASLFCRNFSTQIGVRAATTASAARCSRGCGVISAGSLNLQSEQLNHRLRASPDSRQFARYRVYDKDTSPRSNQGHKINSFVSSFSVVAAILRQRIGRGGAAVNVAMGTPGLTAVRRHTGTVPVV